MICTKRRNPCRQAIAYSPRIPCPLARFQVRVASTLEKRLKKILHLRYSTVLINVFQVCDARDERD